MPSSVRQSLFDQPHGVPNTILGRPIVIDQNMASIASQAIVALYGDLSAYHVRVLRGGTRILRLEERYADLGHTGFLGFTRMDGDLVDGGGGAVKSLKMTT